MPTDKDVDALLGRIVPLNSRRGYYLNSDTEFTRQLLESLLVNEERYGYQSCPCRLATGTRKDDIDIICPCDYRDQDVVEFGACYCGLYVSKDITDGKINLKPIPERRPTKEMRNKMTENNSKLETQGSKLESTLPVWRCSVCGYLCARTEAPEVCPICGVSHDRFEIFSQ